MLTTLPSPLFHSYTELMIMVIHKAKSGIYVLPHPIAAALLINLIPKVFIFNYRLRQYYSSLEPYTR
jgi:hypothetical protein